MIKTIEFNNAVKRLTNECAGYGDPEAKEKDQTLVNIYIAQQQQKTADWMMRLTIAAATIGILGLAISIYATFFK